MLPVLRKFEIKKIPVPYTDKNGNKLCIPSLKEELVEEVPVPE